MIELKLTYSYMCHNYSTTNFYPLRLSIYLQIPRQLSGFHMHAVIPMIQVVVNSIGQPQLCHTTLTFIREVLALKRKKRRTPCDLFAQSFSVSVYKKICN